MKSVFLVGLLQISDDFPMFPVILLISVFGLAVSLFLFVAIIKCCCGIFNRKKRRYPPDVRPYQPQPIQPPPAPQQDQDMISKAYSPPKERPPFTSPSQRETLPPMRGRERPLYLDEDTLSRDRYCEACGALLPLKVTVCPVCGFVNK